MSFPIRLLIVEDSATTPGIILQQLESASFEVSASQADSEVSLRALLASSDPDVIIAGFSIPEMDGTRILNITREMAPEVPVIVIDGPIGEERVAEALRNGATDYILNDRFAGLAQSVLRAVDRRKEGDRRRLEHDSLLRAHQRFEYVAKATSDALWEWEIAGNAVWEIDGSASGADSPIEQHDVGWWFARVHPEERQRVGDSLRAAVANGEERWNAEYRFRLEGDAHVPVSSRAYVIADRSGRPVRVVGAVQDASERRRAESAMRESEFRCRSIAEAASDAIFLTTADCTIIYANQQASRMFGIAPDAMIGRNFVSFLPEHTCGEHGSTTRALGSGGGPASATSSAVGLRADGSEFAIELSIATFTRDGELFFTKVVRDVSERLTAQRLALVQFQVTRLLAESKSPLQSLPQVVELMAEGFGWQGAAVWLLDSLSRRLTCAAVWMRPDSEVGIAAFRDASFEEGEGLPGLAFRSRSSETVTISAKDPSPHHAAAAEAGILRATAVPIAAGKMRLGVIEFFERDGRQAEPAMLAMTNEIAAQLGHYLERAFGEAEGIAALARLREAQHLACIGSWEYDIKNGSSLLSEEVYAIFNMDPMSPRSLDLYIASIHPEDRERVSAVLRSQYESGKPETLSFRHRIDRAGEERVVEGRSRVVIGDGGVPQKAIGTFQDITEQSSAAIRIQQLSKQSDLILECVAEGVVGLDREGRVTFINPAARDLFSRTEIELRICPDVHALVHHTKPDGTPYPREECPIFLTLHDGEKRSARGEYFWRPDGPFFVDYECAAVMEGDEIAGAVMTFRDVMESHRLNRRLELSQRIGSLGRVAATIAHEFNNVLMGIEPFAEIIRRRMKDDEKVVMAANQISNSVRRGRRVTDEILRFTRPVELMLKDVDLKAWLLDLEPELRALSGPNARLLLTLPESPTYAPCDPAQLQQVVTNLVLNARDVIAKEGTISIILRQRDALHAELTIRDSGPGIPEHAILDIFEPLYTTKRGGTGLGLAVARRIVIQHGGSIDASNPPGGGAEFCLVLPIGKAAPAGGFNAAVAGTSAAHTLLLVEDEEAIAAGVMTLLDAEGFAVQWISRGAGVVEEIARSAPHCIILDLTLPDMDGVDVFRMLRQRWPGMPVVFSTGHGGEAELAEALVSGHVVLLQKPYAIEALIDAVHQAVAA